MAQMPVLFCEFDHAPKWELKLEDEFIKNVGWQYIHGESTVKGCIACIISHVKVDIVKQINKAAIGRGYPTRVIGISQLNLTPRDGVDCLKKIGGERRENFTVTL